MRIFIIFCLSILLMPAMAWSSVMNGGFEDDFTGWTTGGNTAVVTQATVDGITIDPFGGDKMASLTYPAMTGFIFDNFIYQDVVLTEGDNWLSFRYNFWTFDEAPFDNPGFTVSVNNETKFSVAAGDIGDGTPGTLDYTDWQLINIDVSEYYSEDCTRPATIRLAFNAGNTGDKHFPSGVFIDQADLTANAVPLPGAVWILGAGLAGLLGLRRQNR